MNLFQVFDKVPNEELVAILASGETIRIERIVSDGEFSPEGFWYDQDEDELVILLQGTAILEFETGNEITLKVGDLQMIPAHQKHRVSFTSSNPPTIWLCIFSIGMQETFNN